MNVWPLPVADIFEWIVPTVVVVVIIVRVLWQVLGKAGGDVPQRPIQRGGAGPRAPGPQDPLRDEIGDFLRRVKQQRPGGGPAPPGRPAAPLRPASPARSAHIARSPLPQEASADAELLEVLPDDQGVADHVRKHVATGKFGMQPAGLGQEVAQTDDRLEARLKQTFDHRISRLATVEGEAAQATDVVEPQSPQDRVTARPASAATELLAILRDPRGVRQALLLQEILQRPVHRWK